MHSLFFKLLIIIYLGLVSVGCLTLPENLIEELKEIIIAGHREPSTRINWMIIFEHLNN